MVQMEILVRGNEVKSVECDNNQLVSQFKVCDRKLILIFDWLYIGKNNFYILKM